VQITEATFHGPFEGSDPAFKLRVEVKGSEFLLRAAPIVAQVGNVMVESIVVNMEGDGFGGLLRSLPPARSELKVGYLDTGLTGTGFTYDPPIG